MKAARTWLAILLVTVGVSKFLLACLGLLTPGLAVSRYISALAISPLPMVFDQPTYFASHRFSARLSSGETREWTFPEMEALMEGPWHRRVVLNHSIAFLDVNDPMTQPFLQYYLCRQPLFSRQLACGVKPKSVEHRIQYWRLGVPGEIRNASVECPT